MSDNSVKPVVFSNSKPVPWWRKASAVSMVVTAVVAALLGGWMYASSSTQTASTRGPVVGAEAPDAVQQVLLAGKPTIIEFGANNCVGCREMKPVLHALALDPRIAVADIDILKERVYIKKYQIRLMPTQVFYNAQGIETGRHMGKISAEDILAHLGLAQAGTEPTVAPAKAAL